MATAAAARPVLCRVITASTSSTHSPAAAFLAQTMMITTTKTTASQQYQQRTFSTTPELNERRSRRDNNKKRGLSSMYGSKPSHRMQLTAAELPRPVPGFKPRVATDPEHGLWGFFYAKKERLISPDEVSAHGRAWTVEELRHKSWEDLHRLWWTCAKERNRIGTMQTEYKALKYKVGEDNMEERTHQVGQSS